MPTVFVSSTSRDLATYREAALLVCRELGLAAVGMEDFEAMGLGATAGSLAKLDQADVYLGIFGYRYGFIEPGYESGVIECEFDHAAARNLERLCFVVDPEHPWPAEGIDLGERIRLDAFMQRMAGFVIDRFTTVEDFRQKVLKAVSAWKQRAWVPTAQDPSVEPLTDSPFMVCALPTWVSSTSFTANWSGTDDTGGSGLASYSVYVSDNGGAFTAWLTATTQTSATYVGQDGHTYGFYSVATDNAGNIQPATGTGEALTLLGTSEGATLTGTTETVKDTGGTDNVLLPGATDTATLAAGASATISGTSDTLTLDGTSETGTLTATGDTVRASGTARPKVDFTPLLEPNEKRTTKPSGRSRYMARLWVADCKRKLGLSPPSVRQLGVGSDTDQGRRESAEDVRIGITAAQRRKRVRRRLRLQVEHLEDRLSPAVVSWTGNAGSTINWSDTTNWSNNAVPGCADDVTISKSGVGVITITGTQAVNSLTDTTAALVESSGSFTLTAGSSISKNFMLASGTLTANFGLTQTSATFTFNGGSIGGTVTLLNSGLVIGAGSTGAVNFILQGSDTLTGNVAAGQSLWVQGSNVGSNATLTVADGVTNHGTILLQSISGGYYDALEAAGAFTNAADGTVQINPGTGGGTRTISGTLVNQGQISVDTSSLPTITGNYYAAGGNISGSGYIYNYTLDVIASPSSPTTILIAGTGDTLATNNLANTTLWVPGNAAFNVTATPNAADGLAFFNSATSGLSLEGTGYDPSNATPGGSAVPAPVIADSVDCTVFAPPEVAAGDALFVQVFLHQPEQANDARQLAQEFDAQTRRLGFRSLELEVTRGTKVAIQLALPGLEVDDPVQQMTWLGLPNYVQFAVTVPPGRQPGNVIGTVVVYLDAVPAGHVKFKLVVTAGRPVDSSVRHQPLGDTARRYEYAFVSYASKDRDEVIKRLQGFSIYRTRFFQDILTLEPGQLWDREIYEHINRCDLFLLFWSTAAKKSEWVEREVRYALARKRDDESQPPEVVPILIEGPPVPEPPNYLKHLHFNDRLLYFLSRGD